MLDNRWVVGKQTPGRASHKFIVLKKPGGRYPADQAALNAMTEKDLAQYRIIIDASSLTEHLKRVSSTPPVLLETLARVKPDHIKSISD